VQRTRATGALRTTADELGTLSAKGEHSQFTAELTGRAAVQAHRLADYLERTTPADLLGQVRAFARRRPAAFLLVAALAGVVVGRVVKGTVTGDTAPQPDTGLQRTYRPEPSSVDAAVSAPSSSTEYRSTGAGVAEPVAPVPAAPTGTPGSGPVAGVGTADPTVPVPRMPDQADPTVPMPGPAGSERGAGRSDGGVRQAELPREDVS
jgi:hypothetical protein